MVVRCQSDFFVKLSEDNQKCSYKKNETVHNLILVPCTVPQKNILLPNKNEII